MTYNVLVGAGALNPIHSLTHSLHQTAASPVCTHTPFDVERPFWYTKPSWGMGKGMFYDILTTETRLRFAARDFCATSESQSCRSYNQYIRGGGAENAGVEMQEWKMRE